MNPESPYTPGGQGVPHGPTPYPQQPYGQPEGNPYAPQTQPQPQPLPQQGGYTPIPPVSPPPMSRRPSKIWVILTFVFLLLTIAAAGVGVWAYMNYLDQRDNVDSKVTAAVATAVKEEQDKAAAHLLEVENEPNRLFVGPEDYGRLTFQHSKLWSVYVDKDALQGGSFEAYLNPATVPPVTSKQQFALRVLIEQKDYDAVIKSYERLVKSGELKSSAVDADGQSGTRLDGNFSDDIKGSAVIFKIRDKTVTIRTDAPTFEEQFNALIKTITFNK